MYVCMYVRMYVCMYVCMYACMYVCVYVCMYVCMRACMYVCMYVCVCMFFPSASYQWKAQCVISRLASPSQPSQRLCKSLGVQKNMYVCMCVCVYVCMYVCMHACMYVCMYVCMCICMCIYIYIYIYIQYNAHLKLHHVASIAAAQAIFSSLPFNGSHLEFSPPHVRLLQFQLLEFQFLTQI